jgi:hypothetical protein
MLNLPIAMFLLKFPHAFLFLVSMLIISDGGSFSGWKIWSPLAPGIGQPGIEQPSIQSPGGGEALQGVVLVSGTTDVPGFRRSEVAFAYQNDPTSTWFLIQQSEQPVIESVLANWDTTTIGDGTYQLRLQVVLEDGQVLEQVVAGLRVRNYTQIETNTPVSPAARQATGTLVPTPLSDFQVMPRNITPAPTNPAQLDRMDLQQSALRGTLVVFSALLVGVLYLGLRALIRRG